MNSRAAPWAMAAVSLALIVQNPPALRAQSQLPIVDTHVHYNRDAWSQVPPASVVKILAAAGVTRVLLSSRPDDGTVKLYRFDPKLFIPMLGLYRGTVGENNWTRDAATPAYAAKRLQQGFYRGIGEIHLHDPADANTATVREVTRLAAADNLVLHVHGGEQAVRNLFALEPQLRILWAHAGSNTAGSGTHDG